MIVMVLMLFVVMAAAGAVLIMIVVVMIVIMLLLYMRKINFLALDRIKDLFTFQLFHRSGDDRCIRIQLTDHGDSSFNLFIRSF